MPREISAGAVVFRRDSGTRRYLLLHYGSGHWDFPKGNVEQNETSKVTARREIEEETGIKDIQFISGFTQKINYFYKRGGNTISKEVLFLLAETRTETVTISFEHIGYEWLGYREAHERITHRNSKNVLEQAEQFLASLKD